MKHVWGTVAQIKDLNIVRNPLEYLVAFPVQKTQFQYCVDAMDFAYKPDQVPAPSPDVWNVGGFQGLKYFKNTSLVWLN